MTFGRMKTAASKRGKGNAMNEKMKILIAYDGSDCAEAALKDLQRAGLPKMAEAVALSVATYINQIAARVERHIISDRSIAFRLELVALQKMRLPCGV